MILILQLLIYGIVGAVAWPAFLLAMSKCDTLSYEHAMRDPVTGRRRRDILAPPAWLFGPVWTIMFGLIIAGMAIYVLKLNDSLIAACCTFQPTWLTTTILALFFANISFNHYWSIVFFRYRSAAFALVIAMLIMITAIALVVFFAVDGGWQGWVAFGVFVPYALWSIYAFILNASFLRAVGERGWRSMEPAAVKPRD